MADSAFDAEIERVKQAGLKAMQELIFMVEADTKQLCPVKTGTLKRSYTSDTKIDGDNIIGAVGSNVEYAYWVDQKQPHLTQAVDQNKKKIQDKIENALKERG